MSKLVLLAILLTLAMCNKALNSKYNSFLSGQGEFSEAIAQQIYKEYQSPFNERSFFRFQIFKKTLLKIREHNSGDHSYTMGVNQFSDMTFQEFKFTFLNEPTAPTECTSNNKGPRIDFKSYGKFPAQKDWSNVGLITNFKQRISKLCGNHWSFVAVGSLEAFHNKYFQGKNRTFAEQQVIDCFGGCKYNIPASAFTYIRNAGGIMTDKDYPFVDRQEECKYDSARASGYVPFGEYSIQFGDENQMQEAVAFEGPVASTYIVTDNFKNYLSGIFSERSCKGPDQGNFALLIVGYGIEDRRTFWRAKNFWGPDWGDQGYVKIEFGRNMCGISNCASFPLFFPNGKQKQGSLQTA